ncbi:hypothetical protein BaRGS_00024538, partial [Batillaria attramentaria]
SPKFVTGQNQTLSVDKGNLKVIIGAAIGAFLLFTGTVIVIFRHRKGRNRTQPPPAVELDVIERQSLAREGDGSAPSVHIYWDADPPAADVEDDVTDNAPPPVCHGPRNPPADYLNPEPSRDETEEEGAKFNTVPFYQNTELRNIAATGVSSDNSQTAPSNNNDHGATGASNNRHRETGSSDDKQESDTETDSAGYLRYSPRLYENTKP